MMGKSTKHNKKKMWWKDLRRLIKAKLQQCWKWETTYEYKIMRKKKTKLSTIKLAQTSSGNKALQHLDYTVYVSYSNTNFKYGFLAVLASAIKNDQ